MFDQPTNFRGMTVSDALSLLTQDTGVNLVVEDEFKDKVIDNSFVGGETLEEIINIIATTNGMKVRAIGSNTYALKAKDQAGNNSANSIVGTVRTNKFGIGIDGAKVTLLNSGIQPVITSLGGKFIINNILPGTYIMKVEKVGYEVEGDFVAVGKEEKNINIDLYRSGEKIEIKKSTAGRSKVLGSTGENSITEQINLLNIGAEEARTILLELMQNQLKTTKNSESTETISSNDDVISLDRFKAIPVTKQNILILSGTQEQVKLAKNLISILDKDSKQVRISAQIIEITDNLFENLGFSWAYSSGSLKPEGPTSNGNQGGFGENVTSGFSQFGIDFLRFFNGKNDVLNFSIDMLQGTNDAVISAVPSILVVNGETGNFKMTDESVTSYETDVAENGAKTITANLGEAGTILNVTPVIRDDNSIQLKIKVEKSKFLNDEKTILPDSEESFFNPKSQRVIETIVNVNNGDTIFIGGMKTADIKNDESKVPFLGDVPIVGEFFKSTRVSSKVNDLYVKLKIDIVNGEMAKEQPDLRGFMMQEIHNMPVRGGENIKTNLYPRFPQ
ncbi:MAG: secretin N-terminal domain-containing protein [Fusobacteriaceae bacterium]